jgi:hypothetical protein
MTLISLMIFCLFVVEALGTWPSHPVHHSLQSVTSSIHPIGHLNIHISLLFEDVEYSSRPRPIRVPISIIVRPEKPYGERKTLYSESVTFEERVTKKVEFEGENEKVYKLRVDSGGPNGEGFMFSTDLDGNVRVWSDEEYKQYYLDLNKEYH